MQRLADYFVVVGYDHDEERSGRSFGKIIQRFPEKDWPDCPFNRNVVHFCQPQGWMLSPKCELPTFFISILTDLDGQRHYCACLTFHETLLPTTTPTSPSTKPTTLSDFTLVGAGDEADDTAFVIPRTQMFAPKCLVLTSKFDCFEIFRNCLGLLYTVYIEPLSDIKIENLVGNILGSISVPPAGGQALRFSVGADDRQVLQPPLSSTVPCTGLSVYNLFKELGIDHVVTIFCAVLSDIKILFFSKSYSKLTDSCKAVEALLFPLKYCYTFIPVLPFDLLEILDAPTPYIVGVHSDQKLQALSNFDGMWIDLDGSSVHLTDGVKLAPMPDKMYCRVLTSLFQVLKPDIHMADLAFPTCRTNVKQDGQIADYPKYKDDINKDKQIRSIFIRLFSELFAGYRSCLLIIRINPKPVISFHKASFLGHHRLVNDEFMQRVLDSMSFHKFIEERGPPYRSCDIFDEVYASIHEQLKRESDSTTSTQEHIRELANQLLLNENPSTQQTYTQKVTQPSNASYNRTNLSEFPHLEKDIVHNVIKEGLKRQQNSRPYSARITQPSLIKIGTPINILNGRTDLSQSARRLEVLKQCVGYIFNDKIADAKKTSGAVFYSLKSHEDARIALCVELASYKKQNKPRLNNQQFEMIVNLLNCALEAGSPIDEHGIAYKMLILATTFHRKLSEEATQFIYTDIQRHPVWNNFQFWEMSFYSDVQLQIRNLYLSSEEYMFHNSNNNNNNDSSSSSTDTTTHHTPKTVNDSFDYSSQNGTTSITSKSGENNINLFQEKTALEIAAEQMRLYTQKSVDEQRSMQELEEQTLYALAIHYIQLMVYMKLPLDISSSHIRHSTFANVHNSHTGCDRDSISSDLFHNNDRYSVRDADETSTIGSRDSGNEFDMNDDEATDLVLSFVKKFVDKICDEGGVTQAHKNSLHTKLFQTVQVQIEVLEKVYRETRRVAPMPKPTLPRFIMIPENTEHEEYYALRSYLLPDGRDEFFSQNSVASLLPAEGALIMTNYRLIFKGRPVNPTISNEYLIVRSFPISSLIREKKLSGQFRVDNSNICLHNGMQLRSATFQLIKVYFDDEVSLEDIEKFRNKLVEKRYPESVFQSFSFSIYSEFSPVMNKQKDGTLKKYSRYARNVLRKKGLIPAKDLNVHHNRNNFIGNSGSMGGHNIGSNKTMSTSTNSTKYNQVVMIRTPEPPRRSLTLSNTRSPKSVTSSTLNQTSSVTTTTTIHECDEMIRNNSDDEDEDSLSTIDEADSTNFNDTKSLERYADSIVYKDFVRQGLITNVTAFGLRTTMRAAAAASLASAVSLPVPIATSPSSNDSNGQQQPTLSLMNSNIAPTVQTNSNNNGVLTNTVSLTNDDCFRVSHINRNFTFCRSYPLVLVLPKDVLDESLKKVARCHKLQRVPVIVWRNPRTKALLLRGSAFCNKGFINLLVKGPQTTNSSSSDTNASIEQERYFDAIVKLTPNKMPFSEVDNDEIETTPEITPLSVRKNHHYHPATTRLQNFLPTRVR
ncbi:unnamed protein product, partial [Didymodactylos carnosus]